MWSKKEVFCVCGGIQKFDHVVITVCVCICVYLCVACICVMHAVLALSLSHSRVCVSVCERWVFCVWVHLNGSYLSFSISFSPLAEGFSLYPVRLNALRQQKL